MNLRRSACNAQIWKSIYTEAKRVPQRRVDFKNQLLKMIQPDSEEKNKPQKNLKYTEKEKGDCIIQKL